MGDGTGGWEEWVELESCGVWNSSAMDRQEPGGESPKLRRSVQP